MKMFRKPSLWLFVLIIMGGLALALTPGRPAAAQSGSSCINCHETEGKNPVGSVGPWHIDHAESDLCTACHSGDQKAADQASAHIGILTNPLEDIEMRCGLCHPGDYEQRAQGYLNVLATEAAQATPTTAETPTTAPTEIPPTDGTAPPAEPTEEEATVESSPTIVSPSTPTLPPPAAGTTGTSAGGGGINWRQVLGFARGPLFTVAKWIFLIGMLLRLGEALWRGWGHRRAPQKAAQPGGKKFVDVVLSYLKGLLVFPFLPWLKGTFQRSPMIFIAGGLFHLGLFVTLLFSRTHISVWESLIKLKWTPMPSAWLGWFSAIALAALLILLINRIINPVLRLISGPGDYANWVIVFLAIASGFIMARNLWLPFEVSYSLHMLIVCSLLIYIPFSRISHFIFYFFSRTIHGLEFGRTTA